MTLARRTSNAAAVAVAAMPGAELQSYFTSASYPPDLIQRAKVIAKQAGY